MAEEQARLAKTVRKEADDKVRDAGDKVDGLRKKMSDSEEKVGSLQKEMSGLK